MATALAAVPVLGTFADTQTVDGDLSAPGIQRSVNRAVAPGATVTVTARLEVNYGSNQHATPGTTIQFVVDPATTTLPSGYTVGGASVTIPAIWATGSVAVASATTTITFTATTSQTTKSYSVGWKPSPSVTGITTSRTLTVKVTTSGVAPPPPDTTPPVLSLPANISRIEAASSLGAPVTFSATAVDAVDGSTPLDCTASSGDTFAIGTTVVTCSATDTSGNTATGSFTVEVVDSTPPTISGVAAISAEAQGPDGATVTYATPIATDVVDGARTVTCVPASGSRFPLGSSTITCAASDTRGNSSSATASVTVTDSTAPVIVVPTGAVYEATGPTGASAVYTASAVDSVDGAVTPSCTRASGSLFSLGSTTVTCTATDAAGNSSAATFTLTVRDTTAPLVTVPVAVTAEATSPAGAPVPFSTSAQDAVSGPIAATCDHSTGAPFPLGDTTVTCSAQDSAGNQGHASFVVHVLDRTPPTLTLPADIAGVEATSTSGATISFAASAVDAVDGPVTVGCSPTSGSDFAIGTTTVNCSSTDAAGNVATGSFTVSVVDTTGPSISTPAPITAEAANAAGAPVEFAVGAFDAVSGLVAASCDALSGQVFPLGTTTVHCSATDDNGNASDVSFTITVADTTSPTITLPTIGHVEATGPTGASVSYGNATATDRVDPSPPVACAPSSGTTFSIGTTTVSCTSADASGNSATASFLVTVSDTTSPDLVVPSAVTAEAVGPSGASVSFSVVATDAVDGTSLSITCDRGSGTSFPLGDTTVTCSTHDASGNVVSRSFVVSVVDTAPPTLAVPASILDVEATSSAGASATYAVSANDLVDSTITPTCSTASGASFPVGNTVVTCTATDHSGNSSSASFIVNVTDTTAPVVHLPSTTVVEADGPAGAQVTFTATADDLVDGAVLPTCSSASTTVFPIGITTVSCSATDRAGNTATGEFTVRVVDTTAPTLAVPANQTLEATASNGATLVYSASATDVVDGALAVSCSPVSGSRFALGTTTAHCSSTDSVGNSATASFTVNVIDSTAPTVSLPASVSIGPVTATGADVSYSSPSASDAVDGPVSPTCSPSSGTHLPIGPNTVTCTATDAAGNHSSGSFVVTISDTTAPSLTAPADLTIEAAAAGGTQGLFSVNATDNVDGPVPATCNPPSGSTFPLGATTVQCTTADSAGNHASASFTVNVADTVGPRLTLPSPILVEASASGGSSVNFVASAVDDVDGPVTPTCSRSPGSTFAVGTTLVTCSATDAHGNASTGSFGVTVVDSTAPTLTLPPDSTVVASSQSGVAYSFSASANDAVSGSLPVTCSPASGSVFPVGSTSVSCSATDGAGNMRSGTFLVTVTLITRVEFPGLTYNCGCFSSVSDGTFTYGVGGTGIAPLADPDCSAAQCARLFTANYSFTLAQPAALTVYGMKQTNGCTCRTWSSDYGPASVFSDYVSTSTSTTFRAPFFTTTILRPGSHTLQLFSNKGDDLYPDFLEIASSPSGTATTPPTLTVTGTSVDQTVYTLSATGATLNYTATAKDIYNTTVAVSCDRPNGAAIAAGTTSVTCTATDARGNSVTRTFVTTVVTNTARVEFPGLTYACSCYGSVSSPPFTYSVGGTGIGPYADRDCSGGQCARLFSATYTVTLTQPASITVYGMKHTAGCTCRTWAIDNGTASPFSDYVATLTDTSFKSPFFTTAVLPAGSHTLRLLSNKGDDLYPDFLDIKNVVNATASPPVITITAPTMVSSTNGTSAVVTYAASAIDAYGASTPVSCTPTSGTPFSVGSTDITCTATDARGNSASKATSTVVASTPTRVEFPAQSFNGSLNAAPFSLYASYPGATVISDSRCTNGSCSSFTTAYYTFTLTQPGAVIVYGMKHTAGCACRTWTVSGNPGYAGTFSDWVATSAEATFNAPLLSTPILAPGTYSLQIASNPANTSDTSTNATSSLHPDYLDIVSQPAGTATAPPLLTMPSNQTVYAPGTTYTYSYTATASDIFKTTLTPTCDRASGTVLGAGSTTITCTATDARGNTTTKTVTIAVVAKTTRTEFPAQTFSCCLNGPPISETTSSNTTYAFLISDPRCLSGSCASVYSASYSFTLTQPGAVTLYGMRHTAGCVCRTWSLAGPASYSGTFNDWVATDAEATFNSPLLSTPILPPGNYNLQIWANPGNSNSTATNATSSLHPDYVDLLTLPTGTAAAPPLLSVPTDQTIYTPATSYTYTYSPSAYDIYKTTLTPTCDRASGSVLGSGATTITCAATDARGNTTTKSFTVTIVTRTTRAEYPAQTFSCCLNSAPWAETTTSNTTYGIVVSDGRCLSGTCPSVFTASYTFTNTAPATITIYGMRTTGGCSCRTWKLDNGPPTTFSDLASSVATSSFNTSLVTTGVISPGSHILYLYSNQANDLHPDYLDVQT